MISVFPSFFILGLVALAALFVSRSRWSPPDDVAARRVAARVFVLAIGAQSIHFVEEVTTGFPERWGALLGLPAMPLALFIGVNLGWIAIWGASVRGVSSGRPSAFFAAWFLAIAGMLNLVAHPLLSLAAHGYFPGLVSSPLVGIAAIWLALRLRDATRPAEALETRSRR